jgi:hypothetical protein
VRNEQVRRIAIALGSLMVLWIGLRVLQGTGRAEDTTLPLPDIDRATVDTITIARPGDTIRLTRTGDAWLVNGWPAAPDVAGELLDAVSDTAATSELVAQSAATHDRLGVDSAQARVLAIRAGETEVLTWMVGKRGANFASAYVRRPGRSNVFQLRGRLVDLVDRGVDEWRDRRILAACWPSSARWTRRGSPRRRRPTRPRSPPPTGASGWSARAPGP